MLDPEIAVRQVFHLVVFGQILREKEVGEGELRDCRFGRYRGLLDSLHGILVPRAGFNAVGVLIKV